MNPVPPDPEADRSEFERQASQPAPGFLVEFIDFLIHNKRWWITPILVVLFLLGLFMMLSASPVAPFIYPFLTTGSC